MPTTSAIDVTMPQLGESVTEGTIGSWLVTVGDHVEKYAPLVEVESDKVSSELPSPMAGTLTEILVEPGQTVAVGTPLCRIDDATAPRIADSPLAATDPEPVTIPDEMTLLRTRSSPYVRRTAEEFGIDLSEISGSGVGGRVTKRDVLARVDTLSQAKPTTAPIQPPSTTGDEIVPLTSMRRAIADTMVRSVQSAPQATVVMEVDMTRVVNWRTENRKAFGIREGIDLTYLPVVLRAVSLALRETPQLNAEWTDSGIVQRRDLHLGVAVALDDGLVVPVIRNADRLSLAGLAHAVTDITNRSRAGVLTTDDLAGGTFTVNNPGTFGSLVSTPILVPGQTGILSMEAIIKRPVVVDDMIAIRSMMNLSLTIDHRALDGLTATLFLRKVRVWLEGFAGEDS